MNITQEQILNEAISIYKEEVVWRKARRAKDKKNLRILIGQSAKGGRHVKKGAPFNINPPKYSGNKDGPGLGLLEDKDATSQLDNIWQLVQSLGATEEDKTSTKPESEEAPEDVTGEKDISKKQKGKLQKHLQRNLSQTHQQR